MNWAGTTDDSLARRRHHAGQVVCHGSAPGGASLSFGSAAAAYTALVCRICALQLPRLFNHMECPTDARQDSPGHPPHTLALHPIPYILIGSSFPEALDPVKPCYLLQLVDEADPVHTPRTRAGQSIQSYHGHGLQANSTERTPLLPRGEERQVGWARYGSRRRGRST